MENQNKPAYPVSAVYDSQHGLTKLEMIAAMCLQGMLANQYSYQYEPKELHERAISHATELLNQLTPPTTI